MQPKSCLFPSPHVLPPEQEEVLPPKQEEARGLQQWTLNTPGLFYEYPNLYLTFRGTNYDQIYVCRTSDFGKTLDQLQTIPSQATDYAPAFTSWNSELILAWRGTDSVHHINAMITYGNSTNPLSLLVDKVVFPDTANGGVSLTTFNGQPYIAWAGTDPDKLLNIMPLISSLWTT
jgi:hypothetical protein